MSASPVQPQQPARGPVPPRFQQGPLTTALQLGPLAFLAGSWRGPGFNAIWRPDNSQPPENSAIHRFLELNRTTDGFDFHIIPGWFRTAASITSPISIYMACIISSGSATPIRSSPRQCSLRDIRKQPARRCISSQGCS
jgi:hypothetical protein